MYRKLPSSPVSCFIRTPFVPARSPGRSVADQRGSTRPTGPRRRCARLGARPTMSDMDAPTETATGWLSPEQLELVRANVPLVYVDAIPVRVDGLGRVTEVGMLLRVAADGSISRMVVSGRVLFGERVRDALMRHLEKDLGPLALPRLPGRPDAVHGRRVLPRPRPLGFHDPRHHAVSLAYVVPVDGDCQPTQEALDLAWFTPRRGGQPVGARADDRRPRPPDPPRPRPRRRAAVATGSGGIRHSGREGTYRGPAMPEGDTIHRAAAALRTALVDEQDGLLRGAAAGRHHAPCRADRSSGREPRQAPRDRVGRRRHPAHAHAAERLVAPLPRPVTSWQRPHRELRALVEVDGWRRRVLQRAGRRDVPPSRCQPPPRARAGSGPTSAAPTPTSQRCVELLLAYDDPDGHHRRGAARPAGVLRGRQRVPVRGAVGQRAEPVRPASATSPRPTPCGSSTSPPSCCGPTCARHRAPRAGVAWRPRRLRAERAARARAAARRSSARRRRITPGSCTGARAARSASTPRRPDARSGCRRRTDRHPPHRGSRPTRPAATICPRRPPMPRRVAGATRVDGARVRTDRRESGCDFTANLVPTPTLNFRIASRVSGRTRSLGGDRLAGRSCWTPCTTGTGRRRSRRSRRRPG